MSKREPGWYAVKDSQGVWEPAQYVATSQVGRAWWYRCGWYSYDEALGCEIGPRLFMPGECQNEAITQAAWGIVSQEPLGMLVPGRALAERVAATLASFVEKEKHECATIADEDAKQGREDLHDPELEGVAGVRVLTAERIANNIRSRKSK